MFLLDHKTMPLISLLKELVIKNACESQGKNRALIAYKNYMIKVSHQ